MLNYTIFVLALSALSCKAPQKAWVVSTIADTGKAGFGDGGPAASARLNVPSVWPWRHPTMSM